MSHIVHPVILCGGSGTRLWPLSTPEMPKQFKALTSDKSMIEETAERFAASHDPSVAFSALLVVGSVKHRKLLDKTLPEARKILEPFGRNSAPAVAAACLTYAAEDLILILPADHSIQDVPAFHLAIAAATKAAEEGAIVTFGIEPTHPATGYGYIKAASADELHMPVPVEKFVEKPDLAAAQSYLDEGSYYWNAGIFLFRADVMLDALDLFAPEVLSGTRAAMPTGADKTKSLDTKAFATTPSISIDYAVLEKAENVQTVPVNMAWSDVGGYPALHGLLTNSASDNHTHGPVLLQNAHGMYVRSEGPTVAVNGVSNLVVVATKDEVVITPMDDAQAVKALGAGVQSRRHALGLPQGMVERVQEWLWAAFKVWAEKAWDAEQGGFVEQLSLAGEPDLDATRRVRVQARQIFSFAKAIEVGWPERETARKLVCDGVEYVLTRLSSESGGFVHTIASDGSVLDPSRDLYDHAFLMLAGAAAFKATKLTECKKLAAAAGDFVRSNLRDDTNGGYFEADDQKTFRRSNPHMHLLEAFLELHSATEDETYIEHAAEIVCLFESNFFDSVSNTLGEYFEADWSRFSSGIGKHVEPGHHYEWATLLAEFERRTGRDLISWRRRLIRKADEIGRHPTSGLAYNCVDTNGGVINGNHRLWPQFEMFRASISHPDILPGRAEQLLDSIFSKYLEPGPTGGWIDEYHTDGMAISSTVPASMLYHAVTALAPLSY